MTTETDQIMPQGTPRQLVIETLSLPKSEVLNSKSDQKTKCFLCGMEFNMLTEREAFLTHVITVHKDWF